MTKTNHDNSLINQKFGDLIVIAKTDQKKWNSRDTVWQCRCVCGNDQVYVTTASLKNGSYRSCGCKHAAKRDAGVKRHIQSDRIDGTRKSALISKPHKDSKSGIKGVCYVESRKKWRAYIGIKGKTKSLGYFVNKEDAIQARLDAEELYHKPYLEQRSELHE